MRLAHMVLGVFALHFLVDGSQAQIPPFPESIRISAPTARIAVYSPPPAKLTPESYSAYRKQALSFLENQFCDEKGSKVCLDLALAALAVGNRGDEESAIKTLFLNHGASDEAAYIVLNQKVEKTGLLLQSIVEAEFRTLDRGKISSLQHVCRRVNDSSLAGRESMPFYEFDVLASVLLEMEKKKKEVGDQGKDTEKKDKASPDKKDTNTSAYYAVINSPVEDGLADYFMISGKLKGTKNPEVIYAKYMRDQNPVDLFISYYQAYKTKAFKILLLYLYENHLSKSQKEKYSVRLVKSLLLLELGFTQEALPIISDLVKEKKEPMARNLRAWVYLKEGKDKEAIEELRAMSADFPDPAVQDYCGRFALAIERGFSLAAASELRNSFRSFKKDVDLGVSSISFVVNVYKNLSKLRVFLDLAENKMVFIVDDMGVRGVYYGEESRSYCSDSKEGMTYESKASLGILSSGFVRRESPLGRYTFVLESTKSRRLDVKAAVNTFLNQKVIACDKDFAEFLEYTKSKPAYLFTEENNNGKKFRLLYPEICKLKIKEYFVSVDRSGGFKNLECLGEFKMDILTNEKIDCKELREKSVCSPAAAFFDQEASLLFENFNVIGDN